MTRKNRVTAVSILAALTIFLFWVVLAQAGQMSEAVVATGTLKESGSSISIPTNLAFEGTLTGTNDELANASSSQIDIEKSPQKGDFKKYRKPVGTIAKMYIQSGDQVRSGDVLFAIDDSEARATLEEVSARYDVIEKSIEKAAGTHTKSSPYVSKKIAILLKRRDQLKVAVQIAEKALDATIVKATDGGVVKDLKIDEGSVVYSGQPVMSVVQPKILSVDIFVPVSNAKKIKNGQPAEVRVDAASEMVFEGNVTAKAGKAEFAPSDMATNELELLRVIKVTVEVENKDDILKAGMPADITIKQSR